MRFVHISLLVLITSLVFSNTLENDYHLDSILRVQNNEGIERFWPPARFFTDVRSGSSSPQINTYRPMMPLSHSVNNEVARISGTSRLAGYHVGNIAIHFGSAILVYFLFCLLISRWAVLPQPGPPVVRFSHMAFAAALIFAVHPISGSAVNYIAARDLLLMVFFFMASFLTYVAMCKDGFSVTGWFLSLLLLSLAILSKQSAIIGFGLVFLFEWILVGRKLRDWQIWARTAAYSIPTVAFFALHWLWISRQGTGDPLRIPGSIFYALTMAKAHLFYYLKNFSWPFEMRALAKFDRVDGVFDPAAVVGLIFIVSTLILAWLMRTRKPLIAFSILAYWLLFALTASIFPFRFLVTDYRQYLPFIFLCLIVSQVCFSLKPRFVPIALLAGMTFYFSCSSYLINRHWKSEESFWLQSVKHGGVALAHSNYGRAIASKNPELAERHYLEALSQYPSHLTASINLGMLYIHQGKTQQGLAILMETTELNPGRAAAHFWLARGLELTGRAKESLAALELAADLDPRRLQYQYEAAEALQLNGETDASIKYLDRLMRVSPNYQQAGFMLGWAYQERGNGGRAIIEYQRFLNGQPAHVQARFNLAHALMLQGDCETAIEHFQRVLALNPEYRTVHLHLSRCYASLGDEARAAEHEAIYSGDG